MKQNAIIFGVGKNCENWHEELQQMYNIIGYIDNDPAKYGKEVSRKLCIMNPQEILKLQYDKICILSGLPRVDMCKQLMEYGIPFEKIDFAFWKNSIDGLAIPRSNLIDNHIVLEYEKIKIIMDDSQDYCAIAECIIGKGYELGLTNDDYCVIDIGANIGDTALYYASLKNVSKVYAYEPFLSTYNKAIKNIALNPDLSDKIQLFNFGVSNENLELFIDAPKNSTFGASINHLQKGGDRLEIKDASALLESIIKTHLGKQKNLLKLDCEGSEYDIVESLDKSGLLSKIDVLIGEWHFSGKRNENNTKFNIEELSERLTKNAFMFKIVLSKSLPMFYAFRIGR